MSVRNWAVGAAVGLVVVAGLAVVQSGIRGTDVLPAARHGAGESAAQDGAGLPKPGEASAAPPTAGAVHGVRVVVRSGPRAGATAGVQTRPKGDRSGRGKSGEGSDKRSGSNSGSDGKSGSGSGGSGDGSGGGKSDSGKNG